MRKLLIIHFQLFKISQLKTLIFFFYLLGVINISQAQSLLYGVTSGGGNNNNGTIYSFDPKTRTHTVLHHFDGVNESPNEGYGIMPEGALVFAPNGKLYGITMKGGNNNDGLVYSFDPISLEFSEIHHFEKDNLINGNFPHAGLSLADNGLLYGTTYYGGGYNLGIIYSINPSNNEFNIVHSLKDWSTAAGPMGRVLKVSHMLYITTYGNYPGHLYSFNLSTGEGEYYRSFVEAGPGQPRGHVIQASNNKLYCLTTAGGIGRGTLISFDFNTGDAILEYAFQSLPDGAGPMGSLIQASNGKLYGMTSAGGLYGHGTIFSYNILNSEYQQVHSFDYNDGSTPYGNLFEASDGKLYGVTPNGGIVGVGAGTIFSLDIQDNTVTKLFDFNITNGAYPRYDNNLIELFDCYEDADGDSFGKSSVRIKATAVPIGFSLQSNDCDDTDANIYPGATELCDGKDNNCDGTIDESGSNNYYQDSDNDGYGNPEISLQDCVLPEGYVINNLDCDDNNAAINPATTWYLDADNDGYYTGSGETNCTSPGTGYKYTSLIGGGDCNDNNSEVSPGGNEICGNEVDDNCNGQTDEGCEALPLTVSINDVNVYEGDEAVLTISLSRIHDQPVRLNFATKDISAVSNQKGRNAQNDYKATKGMVTIPANTLIANINVYILTDNINEDPEYFEVELSLPKNSAARINDGTGRVTILNGANPNTLTEINKEGSDLNLEKTKFNVRALPNPSQNYFTIITSSNSNMPVSFKVIDILGRSVEQKQNISANTTLTIGENYRPGVYMMVVIQGKERQILRLVKVSD